MGLMKNTLILALTVSTVVGCALKKDTPPPEPPKPTAQELSNDLFQSTLDSDYDSVRQLIKDGADLDSYDVDGFTALMRAVQAPNTIMAGVLIKGGAKIFMPRKDDPSITALDSINDTDSEMNRIFDAEKKRIYSMLETDINEGKFNDALSFSKENYIPKGVTLPASNKLDIELALEKALASDDRALLEHLISGQTDETLIRLSQNTLKASSRIKNKEFLDFLVLNYPLSGEDKVFNYFIEEDATSTDWMISKIEVLNKYSYELGLDTVNEHLLSYNNSITSSDENKSKYLKLLTVVLDSNSKIGTRNHFLQSAVISAAKNSKEDANYLNWITPAVKVWEDSGLEHTGFSFDATALHVIKGIEGRTFEASFVDSIFSSIIKYAPSLDNDSSESIKAIVAGEFSETQKLELLDLILKKTRRLPEEIIAFSIETGGIESLQLLLSSDVPFDQSTQKQAVLAALNTTNSGVTAYQLLVHLKEYGFSFNTSEGAEAVILAFNKFTKDNDSTYEAPLDFLLSITPSPISSLNKDQTLLVLKDILKTTRETQKGWELLNKIIEKVNASSFDQHDYYQRDLDIPGDDEVHQVFTSFTWDYILTMYELKKNEVVELDAMMLLLNTVLRKFPNDLFAMSFDEEKAKVSFSFDVAQNILPLSLLFSLDKVTLTEALETPHARPYEIMFNYKPNRTSFGLLAESKAHYYYFQEEDFWERVTRALLRSDKPMNLPSDKSSVEFVKILISSGQVSRYPNLNDKIKDKSIPLADHDKRCVMTEGSFQESGGSGVDLMQDFRNNIVVTGQLNEWTSLGSFEVLLSLKGKTCGGEDLSDKELDFISSYVPKNIGTKGYRARAAINPLTGSAKRTSIACHQIKRPFGDYYTHNYSPLGSSIKGDPLSTDFSINEFRGDFQYNPETSLIETSAQCYEYSYSQQTHYYGKTKFLSEWYKCAVDKNETPLIRFFENISSDHRVYPNGSSSRIRTCFYN